MEYLDMFLVHWPAKLKSCACYPVPAEEASECLDMESIWAGMERCVELGLCKCIGLSKFSCNKIDLLLQRASIPPAVNQILNVVSFCHLQGIVHRDLKPKEDALKLISKLRKAVCCKACYKLIGGPFPP